MQDLAGGSCRGRVLHVGTGAKDRIEQPEKGGAGGVAPKAW